MADEKKKPEHDEKKKSEHDEKTKSDVRLPGMTRALEKQRKKAEASRSTPTPEQDPLRAVWLKDMEESRQRLLADLGKILNDHRVELDCKWRHSHEGVIQALTNHRTEIDFQLGQLFDAQTKSLADFDRKVTSELDEQFTRMDKKIDTVRSDSKVDNLTEVVATAVTDLRKVAESTESMSGTIGRYTDAMNSLINALSAMET